MYRLIRLVGIEFSREDPSTNLLISVVVGGDQSPTVIGVGAAQTVVFGGSISVFLCTALTTHNLSL